MKLYLMVVAIGFIVFLYQAIRTRKEMRNRLRKKIREQFGTVPDREYEFDEYKKLTNYFEQKKHQGFYIDDITWNDLDMDHIFMLINNTYSSAGEEYLYKILRMPEFEKNVLKRRDELADYFLEHEETAYQLQEVFASLGRTKKISLSEFIHRFTELESRSNVRHYVGDLLFFVSVVLLFVQPVVGIGALLVMLGMNVGTYYREKAEIESYFTCLKYLMDMIACGKKIRTIEDDGLREYIDMIADDLDELKSISKGIGWISMNGSSGSIGEVVMEYVRMITHADLIKFNRVLDTVKNKLDVVHHLYETYGLLDTTMAIASFRKMLEVKCKPEFAGENQITAENVFHPLIQEPVANTIQEKKCVLLTGSNASGKSTFLKTIAINGILAQSIYTCTADRFVTNFYHIYSSMSLRDDLENSESYFIVEIKAIKRIIDAMQLGQPVLCFVDEVLRGTNTVERISASTQILREIANRNGMCFAATHDIELTTLLEDVYSNYHFKEDVVGDDVIFNYKLLAGKATSRNAIKLLKVMGFEKSIVEKANEMAKKFVEEGQWS